jgi:hypothetical protein
MKVVKRINTDCKECDTHKTLGCFGGCELKKHNFTLTDSNRLDILIVYIKYKNVCGGVCNINIPRCIECANKYLYGCYDRRHSNSDYTVDIDDYIDDSSVIELGYIEKEDNKSGNNIHQPTSFITRLNSCSGDVKGGDVKGGDVKDDKKMASSILVLENVNYLNDIVVITTKQFNEMYKTYTEISKMVGLKKESLNSILYTNVDETVNPSVILKSSTHKDLCEFMILYSKCKNLFN